MPPHFLMLTSSLHGICLAGGGATRTSVCVRALLGLSLLLPSPPVCWYFYFSLVTVVAQRTGAVFSVVLYTQAVTFLLLLLLSLIMNVDGNELLNNAYNSLLLATPSALCDNVITPLTLRWVVIVFVILVAFIFIRLQFGCHNDIHLHLTC